MKKIHILSKDNKIHLPNKNKLTWELIESYLINNKWKQVNRYGFKLDNYYITKGATGNTWNVILKYILRDQPSIELIIPINDFFNHTIHKHIEVLHGYIFDTTL